MIKSISGIISAKKINIDSDALTYINAANITNPSHIEAWDSFVKSCKNNGNWSSLKAVYPLIGGNASSHSINARNTSLYNLSFTGTVTHNSLGIQGDSSTTIIDTGIVPSVADFIVNSPTSLHFCYYTSTTTYTSTILTDMGCFQGTANFFEFGVYGASPYSNVVGGLLSQTSVGNSNKTTTRNGVWIAQKSDISIQNFYKNGSSQHVGISSDSSPSILTSSIKLASRSNNSNTISRRSTKVYGFFSIGNALADHVSFSNDILTLQQQLGR